MIKIMPCLDMKNGRVVKGVHFVDIKDAGDPVENAAFYQKEGADELAMLDIAATLENRKTRLEWVKNVAAVITIPLTVGGGISSLEDIELLFAAGATKASMNSAAVNRPALIAEAAKKYGSERITVAIDGALLKRARAIAARRGLSVSALVADELRALVADDTAYESARRQAVVALQEGLPLGRVKITDRESLHERRRVR